MNDVRKMIYGTIIGFFMMLGLWFSIIYVSSCGFTLSCHRANLSVARTPIPTLIPVSQSKSNMDVGMAEFDKCLVAAKDLVGAWASAGASAVDSFTFVDVNGKDCTGTYEEDIQPFFVENSTWQSGSLGCVSCHNADLTDRSGGLDMTSVAAIQQSGILGDDWEKSSLYEVLGMGLTADGHSSDVPAGNPLVYAGTGDGFKEGTTPAP